MMKGLSAALVFLAAVSAASQRQSPTPQEIRQAEHGHGANPALVIEEVAAAGFHKPQ
jgi:hypothetical protein